MQLINGVGQAFYGLGYPEAGNKGFEIGIAARSRLWFRAEPNPNSNPNPKAEPKPKPKQTGTTSAPGAIANCIHQHDSYSSESSSFFFHFFLPPKLILLGKWMAFGKLTAAAAQFECKPQNWIISQWQSNGCSWLLRLRPIPDICAERKVSQEHLPVTPQSAPAPAPSSKLPAPSPFAECIASYRIEDKRQWQLCGARARMQNKFHFRNWISIRMRMGMRRVLLPAGCFMACFTYVRT